MRQPGYGPQVGTSVQGNPIYLYTDPRSKLTSYVIVLPDGRAFHSDQHGNISATPVEANNASVALALIGGIVGLLLGGPGVALIGAALGAVVSAIPNAIDKKKPA